MKTKINPLNEILQCSRIRVAQRAREKTNRYCAPSSSFFHICISSQCLIIVDYNLTITIVFIVIKHIVIIIYINNDKYAL